MKQYQKYIKPYMRDFILGPLLMVSEVLGEILLPKLMSMIINHGIVDRDYGYIIRIGAVMILITLVMAASGIGGAYFTSRASISFASDLRTDIFSKVQEFSFKNLDKFSTGSLITRLTNDIQQIQQVLMLMLRLLLRAPGMLLGALIMAFLINSQLALVILIVIPVLTVTIITILRIAFPRFEQMQIKLDQLNTSIQEALVNIRVIKSFVREDFEEDKFKGANNSLKESSLKAMNVVITTMPVMMLAMNITTLAVVWYGGNLIIGGSMQIGDLTAFTTYIVQILMSLMMLSMVFLQSSRARASVKRVNEVLNTPVDLTDDQAGCKEQQVERGEIEFKDVSFRYGSAAEEMVLKQINLKIEPGKTVGILGATGSGKTTLVQLIPRLYDAVSGQVLVDGIDVREYSLEHLRNGVGMVLQQNVLFSGSIEENLRWGNETAEMDELVSAAQDAQANIFIESFTNGYETDLGQGGSNVSGGQKQRLCIARALLKKPKILILDDSTSAVDTATEKRIRASFQTTLKDTTKLIIAQRISSVEEADQIIVLDEGEIVGMGTHRELLAGCVEYQEIYASQHDQKAEVGAS